MPRLTYSLDDFLRDLEEKTKAEDTTWHLTPVGRVRTGCNECPLEFAFNVERGGDYQLAAKRRGMRSADIVGIVNAADNFVKDVAAIRRQLLRATGLA